VLVLPSAQLEGKSVAAGWRWEAEAAEQDGTGIERVQ